MNARLVSTVAHEQHPIEELLLMQAVSRLLSSNDVDALVKSADALLNEVVPGAILKRVAGGVGQRLPESLSVNSIQIPMRDGEALVLMAPRAMGCLGPLRVAAKLIEARIDTLNQQRDLDTSIEQLSQAERLHHALYQIANLASMTSSDMASMFDDLHAIVGSLMYAKNFYIALYDAKHGSIRYPYFADSLDEDPPDPTDTFKMADIENSPTWYVIHQGKALMGPQEVLSATIGSQFNSTGPVCEDWLGVPLLSANDAMGCVVVQSYDKTHHYGEKDKDLLTYLAQHIQAALERRLAYVERERNEARLMYDNLHDSLTGLPNRTLLMQRTDRALTRYHQNRSDGFAVLFMDLDRFKIINDSMGHQVGDDLLRQTGQRVRACVKSGDVVARLGGDEFSILLQDVNDEERAIKVAERIIRSIGAPFKLNAKELFVSASVGVVFAADHYSKPAELLRDADAAMYAAKESGRNRYFVFNQVLRQRAMSLLEIESDIKRGLSRHEFVPYYQPIVDVEKGVTVGYEALMRWVHPTRGVLLPGAFLKAAEDADVSEALDWEVFAQVCRDSKALIGDRDEFVAINLSARHFSDPKLDQRLFALLNSYAVPASRIHVEVTDRAMLKCTPEVKRILQSFHQHGISLSIDDFGTGYSALSYLHQYPLQTLKIDQSFVASLADDGEGNGQSMIKAILAMAEALHIGVIAEGVETASQRDLLRQLGCHQIQGFLYAKAQPLDTWINGANPRASHRTLKLLSRLNQADKPSDSAVPRQSSRGFDATA